MESSVLLHPLACMLSMRLGTSISERVQSCIQERGGGGEGGGGVGRIRINIFVRHHASSLDLTLARLQLERT